jgi:hypothetical protein
MNTVSGSTQQPSFKAGLSVHETIKIRSLLLHELHTIRSIPVFCWDSIYATPVTIHVGMVCDLKVSNTLLKHAADLSSSRAACLADYSRDDMNAWGRVGKYSSLVADLFFPY